MNPASPPARTGGDVIGTGAPRKAQILMARIFRRIGCGVVLLALTGCRMYGPYGYDGAYAYPAAPQGAYGMAPQMSASPYMAAPVYSSSPGTYPGSSPYYAGPTYSYPSPTAPTYTTTNPELTTTNPEYTTTNPDFTTTNPSGSTSGQRPLDKLVPQSENLDTPQVKTPPAETVDNAPPSTTTSPGGDEADFQGDRANSPQGAQPVKDPAEKLKKMEQKSFEDTESKLDKKVKPSSGEVPAEEEFEAPSAFNPGKTEAPTGDAADIAADQKNTPFAYDQKSLTWFRGTAHFDEAEQAWSVKFAPEGSKAKFNGIIGLLDHSQLSTIKEGDVVLVSGTLDPATKDSPLPKFKIKSLKRLIAEE